MKTFLAVLSVALAAPAFGQAFVSGDMAVSQAPPNAQSGTQAESNGNLALYASPSGTGDCSSGAPCSLYTAAQKIPKIVRHAVDLNLAAGDYYPPAAVNNDYGTLILSGITVVDEVTRAAGGSQRAYLHINGAFATALASQTATGLAAGIGPTQVVTVGGASYTVDAYRGMLLKVTSGGGFNIGFNDQPPIGRETRQDFVVIANNATTITVLPGYSGNSILTSSMTFDIVRPAAILHGDYLAGESVSTTNSGTALVVDHVGGQGNDYESGFDGWPASKVEFKGLKITGSAASTINPVMVTNSDVRFAHCWFTTGAGNTPFQAYNSWVDLFSDYASGTVGSSGAINYGGHVGRSQIIGTYLDCSAANLANGCLTFFGSSSGEPALVSDFIANSGTGDAVVSSGASIPRFQTTTSVLVGGSAGYAIEVLRGGRVRAQINLVGSTLPTGGVASGGTSARGGIYVHDGGLAQIDANTAVTGSSGDLSMNDANWCTYANFRGGTAGTCNVASTGITNPGIVPAVGLIDQWKFARIYQ